jgi:hypothetical protein
MHARYVLQICVCIYSTQSAMRFAFTLWRECYFTSPILTAKRLAFYRLKRARKNTFKWAMCDNDKNKFINVIVDIELFPILLSKIYSWFFHKKNIEIYLCKGSNRRI